MYIVQLYIRENRPTREKENWNRNSDAASQDTLEHANVAFRDLGHF